MCDWVELSISRGPIKGPYKTELGLRVHLKVKSEVESFMSQLANGVKVNTNIYNEGWVPQNASGKLEVYQIDKPLGNGSNYTLEAIGDGLWLQSRQARIGVSAENEKVNISFLKLAGISEEDGVTFGMQGLYSPDLLNKIRGDLACAIERFLKDYIVPFNINLHITSKPY